MKIRIEAEPGEIGAKGHVLLERLAQRLSREAPGVAEALEKAAHTLDEPAPVQADQAIQDGLEQLRRRYRTTLDMMLGEIGRALDRAVDGPAPPTAE